MVLVALLRLLWAASSVLLLGFLAVLIGTVLTYPLDLLSRFVPRAAALVLTLVAIVGGITGVVLLLVPIVTAQAERLSRSIPVAVDRIAGAWARIHGTALTPLPGGESLASRLVGEAEAILGRAVPFAFDAGRVLVLAVVLFVLGLFLAYAPGGYHRGLRRLVPRDHEALFDELWGRLGLTLRHWTLGILVSMTVMGVLAAVGLWIAGIEGWFLLGVLTFLGTFVPYVGALASALPGLLIGLSQSPLHLLYAAIVYALVHVAEGYLVSPFVMRHAVRLQPGLLIFWQLLIAAVFGLPGIIVATPLLAVLEVVVSYLYVERYLGKGPDDGSGAAARSRG
jgi:predicted PurR-regulated permease PerM